MTRIVVAGVVNVRAALNVDTFPVSYVSSRRDPNGISMQLSGSGFIVARTLRDLGSQVAFATYVGLDPLGSLAASGLRDQGFYGAGTQVCESQPRSVVLYDRHGSRAGTSDLRSTPGLTYPADVFADLLAADTRAAVLTNIGFTRSLVPVAVRRGIPIITDLHVVADADDPRNQPWIRAAHVLVCSHQDLPVSPAAWAKLLWSRFGTDLVLVGCGEQGAVLGIRADHSIWRVGAVSPRGVRYTSGAGDALVGAFAHHYLIHGDPVLAVRQAVLAAGWWVGSLPDDREPLSGSMFDELCGKRGLPLVSRLR